MQTITYTVHVEPIEDEGGFNVEVPALPGCITWGQTCQEALDMTKDAIEGYLFSLQQHGEPIPHERQPNEPLDLGIQVNAPVWA
jgi:antitoxin HicB